MKVGNGNIITLSNGEKYLLIKGKLINNENYCLISTIDEPYEIRLATIANNNDKVEIILYKGKDYKEILFNLLEYSNSQA